MFTFDMIILIMGSFGFFAEITDNNLGVRNYEKENHQLNACALHAGFVICGLQLRGKRGK